MRRSTAIVLVLAAALAGACGPSAQRDADDAAAAALAAIREGPHDVAVVSVRDLGTIRFELLPELAPETVASFTELAGQAFYDGTTFHRVIPDFMIQGGDPNTRDKDPRKHGKGGPGYTLTDEFSGYPHLRGTVSMANKSVPHSAGSQFFILQRDTPHLNGLYTAFGRVVEGLDVVDAIAAVEIDKYGRYGPKDRPYPAHVVIESIRIEPAAPAGGGVGRGRAGTGPDSG